MHPLGGQCVTRAEAIQTAKDSRKCIVDILEAEVVRDAASDAEQLSIDTLFRALEFRLKEQAAEIDKLKTQLRQSERHRKALRTRTVNRRRA